MCPPPPPSRRTHGSNKTRRRRNLVPRAPHPRDRHAKTSAVARAPFHAPCVARSSRATVSSAPLSARQACDAMPDRSWRSTTFIRRRSAVRTPPRTLGCSARPTIASPPNTFSAATTSTERFESHVQHAARGRIKESEPRVSDDNTSTAPAGPSAHLMMVRPMRSVRVALQQRVGFVAGSEQLPPRCW